MSAVFGQRLAGWRKKAGMTQRELADACGVNHTYVSKVEAGKSRVPAVETLHRMAAALYVDPLDLCRAAGRFPKPITREELEQMYWLQQDMIDALVAANCRLKDQWECERPEQTARAAQTKDGAG